MGRQRFDQERLQYEFCKGKSGVRVPEGFRTHLLTILFLPTLGLTAVTVTTNLFPAI